MFRNVMPRYEILSADAMAQIDAAWRRLMLDGDDSLLNTATPAVTGQAEPNATVVVKDGPGGPTVCTTTASNTGAFSWFDGSGVSVVMPVGGESSFYTDWLEPDRGKTYKWETFLIKELPTVLERDWRSTDVRGIEGLSMGGTAAMTLAARNPGFYKFAASFSGILQMTSLGMQPAIQFAMRDAGSYDSQKMYGLPSNPAWREHDPYLLAEQLRGTSVYISSGNGVVGPHDKPSDLPLLATNYSGVGLELLSRVTSQQFASELNRKGVPGQAVYRPSGTHTWPYWQFEMTQAWPQAASALGLSEDRPACRTSCEIKKVYTANKRLLGECFTPEYSLGGGRAQDFRGGRIITGPKGPKIVGGAIGGLFGRLGGAGAVVGAVAGGLQGAAAGEGTQRDIIKRCMQGRGYSVLN